MNFFSPKKTLRHPNSHSTWTNFNEEQTLHVIIPYSNPCRWKSRRELFNNTYDHLKHCPNVIVYVVEVAYFDYPFEATTSNNPLHLQIRSNKPPIFHKENSINIAVKHLLPKNYKYAAFFDADLLTTRHDWALETIHLLHRHPWVQIFNSFAPLNSRNLATDVYNSFAYRYKQNPKDYEGATGGGWAWTKNSFDTTDGLFDIDIVGGGDSYMAFSLINIWDDLLKTPHHPCSGFPKSFEEELLAWQTKAQLCNGTIGCTDHFIVHQYHGTYKQRGYNTRHDILRDQAFDPTTDIVRNDIGLIELAGNKPILERAVTQYLFSRNEDSNFVSNGGKLSY